MYLNSLNLFIFSPEHCYDVSTSYLWSTLCASVNTHTRPRNHRSLDRSSKRDYEIHACRHPFACTYARVYAHLHNPTTDTVNSPSPCYTTEIRETGYSLAIKQISWKCRRIPQIGNNMPSFRSDHIWNNIVRNIISNNMIFYLIIIPTSVITFEMLFRITCSFIFRNYKQWSLLKWHYLKYCFI